LTLTDKGGISVNASGIDNGHTVQFEFEAFIQSDYQGKQSEDTPTLRGYIVYNDKRKDFGYGSFGTSDSYTIDYDVLNKIKTDHHAFMQDIIASGGFTINGQWHPVNDAGELQT
jgi:hypothetical protein